jgi:hypothetical protein
VSDLYEWGQLAFALFVLAVVAERARFLLRVARLSDAGVRWLTGRLRAHDDAAARAWADRVPQAFASRVISAWVGTDPEAWPVSPELMRVELSHGAGARLGVLRGCATLGSALGLLGGILAIRRGFGGESGLLALQAGLPQQVALAQALQRMAIGVGTSAVCFFALGVFRKAARELVAQSTHIAHLLEKRGEEPPPP